MATIETIGSSGCDYTSLEAWADAHNADLTSDPNAPYIAQLEPEEFDAGVDLTAEDSLVTDSTHYLEITAKPGYEFKGDFYADFPIIKGGVGCVPYTRISHVVFGKGGMAYAVNLEGGVIIDSVGMWQVSYSASNDKKNVLVEFVRRYTYGGYTFASTDTVVIQNCVVYDVSVHNSNTGGYGATFRGIVNSALNDTCPVRAYNNVIDKVTLSTDGTGDCVFSGIGDFSASDNFASTVARNNIIGSQITGADTIHCIETSGEGSVVEDYNAVSDASGAGSHDINNIVSSEVFVSITEGEENFLVKESSPEATGGIGPDADESVPVVDIAGNERSGTTCPMGAYAEVGAGGGEKAIMNQFQKSNLGADLFNGSLL